MEAGEGVEGAATTDRGMSTDLNPTMAEHRAYGRDELQDTVPRNKIGRYNQSRTQDASTTDYPSSHKRGGRCDQKSVEYPLQHQ